MVRILLTSGVGCISIYFTPSFTPSQLGVHGYIEWQGLKVPISFIWPIMHCPRAILLHELVRASFFLIYKELPNCVK